MKGLLYLRLYSRLISVKNLRNVWQQYYFLLRENHLSGDTNVHKRSHKKNPDKSKENQEPVRKSKRLDPSAITYHSTISITKPSVETETTSSLTTTSTRSKSLD